MTMQASLQTKTKGSFDFFTKSSPSTKITLLWLLQVLVLNIAMLGAIQFAIKLDRFHPTTSPNVEASAFPYIWAHYDSNYYLKIVNEGYQSFDTLGFFPVYPISINLLAVLGVNKYLAGYLISVISWLIALQMFYRTALLLRPDHSYALRCTLLFVFVPTAFFFQAIYAEGLFIVFAVTTTYFILSRRWLLAGLFLGLATVTRPIGWLWGVMFLIEFLAARDFSYKSLLQFVIAGIIALSGLGIYVLYTGYLTGSYTAILQSQAAWHRSWVLPYKTVLEGVAKIFDLKALHMNMFAYLRNFNLLSYYPTWFVYVTNIYDTFFALVGIWLTIFAQKILKRWSITIFLIVSMCFLLSSHGPEAVNPLWGTSRWIPQLFPIFFVFGGMGIKTKWFRVVLGASALWLIAFASWWAIGRWVA